MTATIALPNTGTIRVADLYIVPAGDLVDYEALLMAIGMSTKEGVGGKFVSDVNGAPAWIVTREGLRRFFIVRRLIRLGAWGDHPAMFYTLPDGKVEAFSRTEFDAMLAALPCEASPSTEGTG